MNITIEFYKNKFEFLITLIIISLPIIFIAGSSVINMSVIGIDILFLYTLYRRKSFNYLNNRYFYSLLIFWLYLLFNLFFSIDYSESLSRSVGFIRFVLFAFAISFFLQNKSFEIRKIIFNYWTLIFLLISVDLIFEFIFGFNLFGFESPMLGRLGGVMGQELKIGHFYSAFILICLVNFYDSSNINFINKYKTFINHKSSFYFFLALFVFVSFAIGERSNFIKTFLMCVALLFLIDRINFKKKIISLMLLIVIFFMIIFSKPYFKYRFWDMFLSPLFKNPIEYVSNSKYGSHYKVAIQVFENNKFYGVGLKNYRLEVTNDKYDRNASVHPHQIHFEILSELGLVGYILFISIFFYNIFYSTRLLLKEKDKIQLCGLLFLIATFIPLIPSGSFFTTYGAALFWFNFALMIPKEQFIFK